MIESMQLEPLRARRAAVEKRITDLSNRIAKLERERSAMTEEARALDTTLETVARVYGLNLPSEDDGRPNNNISTKPATAPTLFEMVSKIFDEWDFFGDTHEGQDIYEEIKKRWWPDAPRNSIIPSLWRFANEGRIIKDGTKYGPLQKDEAPGVGAPSASKLEEDLDDEPPL
jgi:hypothetical protein